MPENSVTKFDWDEASARKFHLEQLKLLRAKADKLNEETRATERYVLLASGAIYTFLFAQSKSLQALPTAKFIWWIPPVFVLLGGLRSYALREYIRGCDDYSKTAEDALPTKSLDGWEHYWDSNKTKYWHLSVKVAAFVWGVLFAGTIGIAVTAMFVY